MSLSFIYFDKYVEIEKEADSNNAKITFLENDISIILNQQYRQNFVQSLKNNPEFMFIELPTGAEIYNVPKGLEIKLQDVWHKVRLSKEEKHILATRLEYFKFFNL